MRQSVRRAAQAAARRRVARLLVLMLLLLGVALMVPAGAGARILTEDGGWLQQYAGDIKGLRSVAFSDALHGWAVGGTATTLTSTSVILATSDGGATWSTQAPGTLAALWDVAFVDAAHGWAVGNWGTILATTNGGATWRAQSSGTTASLAGVAFADATHGWAVGNCFIIATTNGGETWSKMPQGDVMLSDVDCSDATHAWAVGHTWGKSPCDESVILATTDAGATWSTQSSGTVAGLYLDGVAFADATHGWAVGGTHDSMGSLTGTMILATANGGATWSAQDAGSVCLSDVAFCDIAHGWAVGYDTSTWTAAILATTNGGATWSAQTPGTDTPLLGVACTDATHTWAVGTTHDLLWNVTGSVIFATTAGGLPPAAPKLTGFTPASGPVGTSVTITGTGLTGATAVTFHGVAAAFSVDSATAITSTVPATATSGTIAVTTPGGTATSTASFTVTSAPVAPVAPKIVKLTPTKGKRGATVTITGSGFAARATTSVVKFGTKKCTKYVSWSDTRIKCKVPAKAKFGKLKVTVVTAAGTSNTRSFTVKR